MMSATGRNNALAVTVVILLGLICGALIAGWLGAAIGAALMGALQFIGKIFKSAYNQARQQAPVMRSIGSAFIGLGKVIATPFVWLLFIPLIAGVMIARPIQAAIRILTDNDTSKPSDTLAKRASFMQRFSLKAVVTKVIGNPAMFILNIIQLIILGCLLFGMNVALYAAILLVPAIMVVLVALAIEGGIRQQS